MTSRRLALGLAAIVAAVVFAAALLLSEPSPDPIGPGQVAPAFELPLLDGATISLASLRGRVVLLNFWATWCKPCEDEMPAMERLHSALAGPGFELVAISADTSRDDITKYRDRLGLTFPIAIDPAKHVSEAYQSYRFPESYLIDRDGTILSRYIGPRDWDADLYVDRIRRVIEGAGAGAVPE